MTKLEEKLVELGYECIDYNSATNEFEYVKFLSTFDLVIRYCRYTKTYYGMCLSKKRKLNQIVIDNSPQAFNQLQKDLEVLKEC